MPTIANNRGHTLVELVTAASVLSLVLLGTASMWIATMRSYDVTSAKMHTDADAVTAMQRIVTEIREAKSVAIVSSDRMRATFPARTADGYYNRQLPDTANRVDYYLSDESMIPGREGDCLCAGLDYGTRDQRILERGVESISFEADTSRSVKVTVVTEARTARGVRRAELTQRVVYLRNY